MPATIPRTATAGPTATFFDELGHRGREPLLRNVSGRVRFDVTDGSRTDSWSVAVDEGELTVATGSDEADCTIAGTRTLLDEIVTGRANMMAAVLRGALVCRGDLELLVAIQRIFPDPPPGWKPGAGSGGR